MLNTSYSPRFCNSGNFIKMPRFKDTEDSDFAIYDIPFYGINILDYLKGGDLGDVNVVPGYIHPSYKRIEEFILSIIKAGALPIAMGGSIYDVGECITR